MDSVAQLVKEFDFQTVQVENTLALFDEGATVPFIARYRKERTGSLNEIQIRDLERRYTYYKELDERRASILESIESQGKLTPELKKKIEDTISKTELEDLYLPYKPKRVTRGKKAADAGLAPLADWIKACDLADANVDIEAQKYVSEKTAGAGYDTVEKIINGACDIIAEEISDDAENRKWLRELAMKDGVMIAGVKKEFAEQKTKFTMYYDFREKVSTLPSHRVLAMFRGERENVLRLELDFPRDRATAFLMRKIITHPKSATAGLLEKTITDCLERLLAPATETEIRKELRVRAEEEAFTVFEKNLRTLLLAAPAGRKAIIGIDPGFRTGCKIVVLNSTGRLEENYTIYPTEPRNDVEGAALILLALIQKHHVELIAIGNGTAGRETEAFVKKYVLPEVPEEMRPVCLIANESGASIYSASDVAIKEFPNHDITVRGSVSIARRVQDPLAELVKIDPKSIGVGQYQHDVNQAALKKNLEEVVESCVNLVGVDVNLASEELLKYVSGLTKRIADAIVAYRNTHGAFNSREELKKVSGYGPKMFEQSAGFLRISNAANPLDNSAVHPERYAFVQQMAQALKTTVDAMIGNTALLHTVDKKMFVSDAVGLPTIEDILSELEKPGRDPRDEFKYAEFSDTIREIDDLKIGMKLEGTVTNVTHFGAFVDVGVHQDGLVHISQLADRYVDDPTKVVQVGQIVMVTVMEVDRELKRIALSMRSNPNEKPEKQSIEKSTKKPEQKKPFQQQKPRKLQRSQQQNAPRKPVAPEMTMQEKLEQLRNAFKPEKKLAAVMPKINMKHFKK